MLNAMPQLVTRVESELIEAVDRLVGAGVVASRSEAVRVGLEQLVDRSRRADLAASIVEGYRRVPQSAEEIRRAEEGLRNLISEEPW
jgi:Arc/MetJ-type ribon-helix-helix transcriptional regulator